MNINDMIFLGSDVKGFKPGGKILVHHKRGTSKTISLDFESGGAILLDTENALGAETIRLAEAAISKIVRVGYFIVDGHGAFVILDPERGDSEFESVRGLVDYLNINHYGDIINWVTEEGFEFIECDQDIIWTEELNDGTFCGNIVPFYIRAYPNEGI